ncbi:hypothetical protein ABFS82_01G040800 [Erythranthe guttata]|uniref:FAS1 domain-containing protein n=1 Tax=Erythranthe guttata TaxID=4155 RepID=A0A022Q351_ERYGU|nr:PREDICTED: fasciclin-like arabinogalactan protein 3 [Erythranthe guttata]EYU22059.1 hypothetical protein MIMGU_mgv1a011491mg [Erythranthe guttata]|eukprot:XP_012855820.1 PREDICTED: fasciclin-like arabinogalactan protein 3 [Erythranthe guttata]
MSPSAAASLFVISAVLLLSATTSAHNITLILDQYPEFTTYNSLLTATDLATKINRRKTLTILALTNDRIGDLAGKSVDVQTRILSTHIVLDYFDMLKLYKFKNTKSVVTTLYQSTGTADDMQGFLNVIHSTDGNIYFGSAMNGAPLDAKVEGSVAKQPYNISVLSISHVIVAPGIDGSFKPVTAPPPKAPASNATSPPAESPEVEEPAADAPAPDSDVAAPADAPAADAPAADAPGPSPDSAPADADQTPPPANAAGKQMVGGLSIGLVMAFASIVLAAH